MKPEKILKLAIEKAVKNGWEYDQFDSLAKIEKNYGRVQVVWDGGRIDSINDIIFSIDFAKALWGEEKITSMVAGKMLTMAKRCLKTWEYHLQEMVLAEDRLKYIEKFLGKDDMATRR